MDAAAATIAATNAFIATQQLALLRPSSEAEKWDGDSEGNVRVFLRRFETKIESIQGISDQQKYEELKSWTKGKARKYVNSMKDKPAHEALWMAKQRLVMFFAAVPRTAMEIFGPVKRGKAVSLNDKEGYQLLLCELESMENSCYINQDAHLLDTVEMIVDVVAARMPKLQREFSKFAGNVYKTNGVISFQTLKVFLGEQITQLSLPCSSLAFEKRQQEQKGSHHITAVTKRPPDPKAKVETKTKASIAATETGEKSSSSSSSSTKEGENPGKRKGRAPCAFCEKMHNLYDCPGFKEMEPFKRRIFVYENCICLRCCNSKTHLFYECPMEMACHCKSTGHHRLTHLTEEEEREYKSYVNKRKEERQKDKAEKEKEAMIVAKTLHGQWYPMPLCLCM